MTPSFVIRRLRSGGLITNYYCTSRCRHCLYRCSPSWPKEYISGQTARDNFAAIRNLGCRSVHIGGGEPLLLPKQLFRILEIAGESGVGIEYVETNASWFLGHDSATGVLLDLKTLGVSTLLVSISPMHNEFIPFSRVKGVLEACRQAGMAVFPWIGEFYPEVAGFDDRIPHAMDEYLTAFGRDYLRKLPQRYWISPGGRALETFRPFRPQQPAAILAAEAGPCRELADTNHFHLDLFGNYVPGLCAGLAIDRDDLECILQTDAYPLLTTLRREGIGGLLELAGRKYGFTPERSAYGSKCELCYEIRRFLVVEKNIDSPELQPRGHYLYG